MNLTKEQQAIVNTICDPSVDFVAVNAVSGSGKTTLLKAIADALDSKNGLYIAYNKAIATEAAGKFSNNVTCQTTHSLAYGNTVRAYHLKVDFFGYRQITENIPYEDKLALKDLIEAFCLSSYTSMEKYAKDISTSSLLTKLALSYLDKMSTGAIGCTHSFYLKMFHILLASGQIRYEPFDLLMLDEAGDLNPVTLEIFKLLPAVKKVMVGDDNQNIYSFNGTINGFHEMKDTGVHMTMSQSFRVADHIANRIENFCRNHLDPDIHFRGVPYTDDEVTTSAFISRTNSALVSEMIDLEHANQPYSLVRPPSSIFRLPLLLIGLKPGKFITDPEYKFLQDDMSTYYRDRALMREMSLFSYISRLYPDDVNLKSAITLITKHSARAILSAFEAAKSHVGTKAPHTLCTAHSSKGLEFDQVTIGDDFNTLMDKIIDTPIDGRTRQEQEEMRLYYVAISRTKKLLLNAKHI